MRAELETLHAIDMQSTKHLSTKPMRTKKKEDLFKFNTVFFETPSLKYIFLFISFNYPFLLIFSSLF